MIAKKAHKGGATIIKNKSMYMAEALTQLADQAVYKRLNEDPTQMYKKEIASTIEEAYELNIISHEIKKALINDYPRTPILYLVPKIHKDKSHPPGRPII